MDEPMWQYFDSGEVYQQQGSGSVLSEEQRPVMIRHIVGFSRPDWGEGNWTAKDLR